MSAPAQARLPVSRPSQGVEQFVQLLSERPGMSVLDLGEFTQANVSMITSLGHRLQVEDLQRELRQRGGEDPAQMREFLDSVLQFSPGQFDAILVWDIPEHLPPSISPAIMDRLYTFLRPGGVLFACFHAQVSGDRVETFGFRFGDSKTLVLVPRGVRSIAQPLNNRAIERLFERFESVKFFLTRDAVREVLVRK